MRIMLLISMLLAFSSADLPEAQYKLKMKEIDKKACKKFSKESICYNVSMKYPTTEILHPDIAQILQLNIDATKKVVFKENPYKMIADIEEEDLFGNREWESETTLELFDYFRNFTTVSTFQYDYTGGAHPNSSLSLFAFKNGSKKALGLSDIIGSGSKEGFISVAEKAYRIDAGLLPDEPLTKDGWFEDKFTMTENFAITEDELLFSYSPYEIKPYALGYTYFTLPYYRLKNIIGKDSVIYDIVDDSKPEISEQKVEEELLYNKGKFKASLKTIEDREFQLEIFMDLYNDYNNLWLSIGLPQYRDGRGVSVVKYRGLNIFTIYPAGSRIYNITKKRNIRSKYLLIEGNKIDYRAYSNLYANLIIKTPKYIDTLCTEIRVTAKNRKVESLLYSPFVDQQGFYSKRICIPVK